jgi:pimeloyl-ACP methyl ester carboxylesterase
MITEPGGFVETSDGTLVHFIDFDLHAEALRTDVNDPVVLIHGLGCNWHHWSRQLGCSHTVGVWWPSTSAAAQAKPGRSDRDGAPPTWQPTFMQS